MTKNLKTRIVSMVVALAVILSVMPATLANAAGMYDGGLGMTYLQTTVYKDQGCTTYQGYLYEAEIFTILNKYSNGVWYIRYSMSSGPKTGYIDPKNYKYPPADSSNNSCVAQPKGYTAVYYGNSSTEYVRAGYVDEEELVVVLAQSGGWSYIEYDTTAGRKRGYVVSSNLTVFNAPSQYGEFYMNSAGTTMYVTGPYNVYSGINDVYTTIGSVSDMNVTVLADLTQKNSDPPDSIYYIEYDVTGTSQKKAGFIFIPRT